MLNLKNVPLPYKPSRIIIIFLFHLSLSTEQTDNSNCIVTILCEQFIIEVIIFR